MSDEVFLPCWISQVFIYCLTYYSMEMPRQCLFCLMDTGVQLHQIRSVIKLPLELERGAQRHTTSADSVNECISHVQLLMEGKVSTQD